MGGTIALASLLVSGTATLDGGAITTTGVQNYDGPVVLAADTTLQGQEANFTSTVDDVTAGTAKLVVQGDAVFNGNVGGSAELSSLSVSGTTELYPTAGPSIAIATTGAQTYTGAVNLGASTLGGYTFSGGGSSIFRAGSRFQAPAISPWRLAATPSSTVPSAMPPSGDQPRSVRHDRSKAGNIFTGGSQAMTERLRSHPIRR